VLLPDECVRCTTWTARRRPPEFRHAIPKCIVSLVPSRTSTISLSDHLANIPPGVRPIVEAASKAVRATAPGAEEVPCQSQKPRSPSMMWKLVRYAVDGEVVVTLGTFTKHASMFFARGSEIEDEQGLLDGTGKSLRYITLRTPNDAKGAAVKEILRKAFALVASHEP